MRSHCSTNVEPRQSGALSYLDIENCALAGGNLVGGARSLLMANIV
jgi:hypothetical protein